MRIKMNRITSYVCVVILYVLALMLIWTPAEATMMKCVGHMVRVGDSIFEVYASCGTPDDEIIINDKYGVSHHAVFYRQRQKAYILKFTDYTLQSITYRIVR